VSVVSCQWGVVWVLGGDFLQSFSSSSSFVLDSQQLLSVSAASCQVGKGKAGRLTYVSKPSRLAPLATRGPTRGKARRLTCVGKPSRLAFARGAQDPKSKAGRP
jgi:hypothetical protein